MATLVYKFSVDDKGNFKYDPFTHPGTGVTTPNWPYSAQDQLRFECAKGPFTLTQRRTDLAVPGMKDPFGGRVKAVKEGKVWVAKVNKVDDGLTPAVRRALWRANQFVSKYRYVIGVQNGPEIAVDDSQAGIHTC